MDLSMSSKVEISNGCSMPILGLGTWQGEGQEGKVAFLKAMELGYRHIDTAYAYQNEKEIGQSLQEAFQRGIVTREDVFVVSKLPHNGHRPDKVRHFLELSLKRLGLKYLDLYLIHWPVSTMYIDDDTMTPTAENKVLIDHDINHLETWKAMEGCVDEGLTRSIGLSNFNSKHIQRIYQESRIKPANLQIECHLYLQQEKLLDFCRSLGVSVTAYAPLGSPGLPEFCKKMYNIEDFKTKVLLEDPLLVDLSRKYSKSPSQVALRFLIQLGLSIIPKTVNESRLKLNSQIFDFTLHEDDMQKLKQLDCNLRFFSYSNMPEMVSSPKYPYSIPF